MAKTKMENDAIKAIAQYHKLKNFIKTGRVQKILNGDAHLATECSDKDMETLKAIARYVKYIGENLKIQHGLSVVDIDRYFSNVEQVYLGGDVSKRVSVKDAHYHDYVDAVLSSDKNGGLNKIATEIDNNADLKTMIRRLPIMLGKEKGVTYASLAMQYLNIGVAMSGYKQKTTEAINAKEAEREKNKRLQEIIKERDERIAELKNVDEKLNEILQKTVNKEQFAAIITDIAAIRKSIIVEASDFEQRYRSLIVKLRKVQDRVNAHTDEALNNQTMVLNAHANAKTKEINAHTDSAVEQIKAHITKDGEETRSRLNQYNKHKVIRWIANITAGVVLAGGAFVLGRCSKDNAISQVPPTTDSSWQQDYEDLSAKITAQQNAYNDFVLEVENAAKPAEGKTAGEISKTEYSALVGKISTEQPLQDIQNAILDRAIYQTEIAQYEDVKTQLDNFMTDNNLSEEEKATLQAAIDAYNAENLDNEFNSASLMSAIYDAAADYSELQVLYANLQQQKPSSYYNDMAEVMKIVEKISAGTTLSAEEQNKLKNTLDKLLASGDDDAELFAEKVETVIDNFEAKAAEVNRLTNENTGLKNENDGLKNENEGLKTENAELKAANQALTLSLEEAQATVAELQELNAVLEQDKAALQEALTSAQGKVSELERQIKENAETAAAKYQELVDKYNKVVDDYNKLSGEYATVLEQNKRIPELEGQLATAGEQIMALQNQLVASQDIVLDYYYQYTGLHGTLDEAIAFFDRTQGGNSNSQGSNSADPEAPSFGR